MTTEANIPTLDSLEYIPYLDAEGQLPAQFQGKVGVYAIFDQDKVLQYVGYSRDIDLSLKQHIVRQATKCYWLKVHLIDRPSRTILESIKDAWISENSTTPASVGSEAAQWTDPIDAKLTMTAEEKSSYHAGDGLMQDKLLKNIARRVEQQILAQLSDRGLKMQVRFNPKLKEKGLLDLKQ
ncbi:GIY-YIG nuclease family protein [Synechocystis sp. PCC 7509]|uniref:GIY-YIG nuclease family protein n=1 Tax=Synechocystis sp. PCC 7509 TaxID=927677 RepID=UPI0002ACA631|nr:GIY-YIG nuclease family protein [Synechocystis sp. PCC 7509]